MRREPQRGLVVGSREIELTAPHIGIAEFRMQIGHHRDSGVIARLCRSGVEPGCEGQDRFADPAMVVMLLPSQEVLGGERGGDVGGGLA